ncbi:MAG TPA: response regulator [Stellaceae bacterium]|nr:response regulator [Stellaceae bacterium]
MIIDDEISRADLAQRLQREGYELHSLAAGADLGALRLDGFDAVLIELFLPQSDAFQTLELVRQRDPTLPVIGMTTRDPVYDNGCIGAFQALGAEAVLIKPIDHERLLTILRRVLGKRAARGEYLRRAAQPSRQAGAARLAPRTR